MWAPILIFPSDINVAPAVGIGTVELEVFAVVHIHLVVYIAHYFAHAGMSELRHQIAVFIQSLSPAFDIFYAAAAEFDKQRLTDKKMPAGISGGREENYII